ncbi:MAG: RNA-binding transcriptional accessory protein [Clostridiales bacterium]|jgi:uncharacterized protein|nr:RNA-binding transcriptional accessory protein [Clostridiales bacterium]
MDIFKTLSNEFKVKPVQVENTVKLVDEGNTIPFIARYRKEMTGSLDDQVLREMHDRLLYLRNLDEKREQVRASIAEQEKLTDQISSFLDSALTLTEIDDIYRPFRPKRRTRATIAKERGLEPLSLHIWEQSLTQPVDTIAAAYVNPEKEVNTIEDAIAGALDIIAEMISDDSNNRAMIRKISWNSGIIVSKALDESESTVYDQYYDFQEPVTKIAGHRVLALNRGEHEDKLRVHIESPIEEITNRLYSVIVKENPFTKDLLSAVIDDSYKRLIAPSIERDIRNELTEKAQEGAVRVFGENLRQLLMQPPIKDKIVLALDPGFRTGCKVAVVDGTGKVLNTGVVYCTLPKNQESLERDKRFLVSLINNFNVNLIAIGNGTASRETESFVANMLKELDKTVFYTIVNEAGASVYSASKLGAAEFPEYDVALRSAVSIGRRVQDPLAELVKIDPKSIGVGQYQHDMNQKRLSETLSGVVESCVNNVGVDLNTASPALLSYVSGISSSVAKNILEYRESNGKFKNRKELMKVKKLGPKAFEQCAGFLRIPESENLLDNTGVHPESYEAVEQLLHYFGFSLQDVKAKKTAALHADVRTLAKQLGIGEPTLKDIIKELEKPGRDPREEFPPPILRSDVLSMEDLQEGMILTGTVRNVIDFGAFVDIGVHQDGLVHISQISDRYIKHPLEVVSVGDIVKVKVMGINLAKKRIQLSIRGVAASER